ncbi:MAG: ABC transporter permease [Gemmatimonadales bacterium]|nr:ABC transporter permease [Gemmatimonadales bacterium]
MITTLAFRHLLVRKIRSLFLLLGFSIGVGVMVVLLSVGEAMLEQSRDVSLVGGGEVTVLPQGIDVEAMRTGGLGAMFFTIERARFLTRQALGGPRHQALVRTVAPAIEGKLLYLCPANDECRPTAVRAGGEIPSRAVALGAGLDVLEGRWSDSPRDSAYVAPSAQQLYDEMDRFHLPSRADSTWGEWHYFNLVSGPEEWWYVTFLVGGEVSLDHRGERWGGRLLLTHRRPDGRHDRYTAEVPAAGVSFDTSRADVAIGESFVRQRDGTYRLHAAARGVGGRALLDLTVRPESNRYFPPVELRDQDFRSGYVVPALAASATGRICVGDRCSEVKDLPAYHDHNWGVWRGVTWEWGSARGDRFSLLYGGVYGPERSNSSPFFLAMVDSLGVRQVLRFGPIRYQGGRSADGVAGARAPERFSLTGTWEADTVTLSVTVEHALATDMEAATFRRLFLQMRGRFELRGRIMGEPVGDRGQGFFETYLTQ